MNILLVRFSALGDITLIVPTVRRIQQSFPDCQITWLTSPQAYSLLSGLSGIEFVVINKPKNLSDYFGIKRILDKRQFDILLAMQASLRINLIYPFVRAKRKIGFDKIRARDGQFLFTNEHIEFHDEHLLDSFLSFATKLGAREGELDWNLAITSKYYSWANEVVSKIYYPIIAINPFSSRAERNWPRERYVQLIDAVVSRWSVSIILIGGPSTEEMKNARSIEREVKTPLVNLVGSTSPKQLAALLSRLMCLVAPDTGTVHIATAMGIPVIGLYAVAPPTLTGPYCSQELVVNKYPEAVRKFLNQNPEEIGWNVRVHNANAMKLIQVEEVMSKLEGIVGE